MRYSQNYRLNEPERNEQYNIDHWNQNTETIDSQLKINADAISKEISDRESAVSEAETSAKDLANATGTLSIGNGGTGATTSKGANNSILGDANEITEDVTDDTMLAGIYSTPSDTNGALHKRKASTLKSWIKGLFASGTGTTYSSANGTFSVNYGTGANTACQGNDSRLSNKREPTSHANAADTYGKATASLYGHAKATSATPGANKGNGSVGTDNGLFARGDHYHPESYSVPIGFTYFQLPGEKDPTELFPSHYIWAEITDKFSGLFFRAEGGNAKSFTSCNYKVRTGSTQTDKTLNLESVSGISVGDKVICICEDSTTVNKDKTKTQVRTVKSIVDTVVTFEESRDYTNFTNVLITQRGDFSSHSHTLNFNSNKSFVNTVSGSTEGWGVASSWSSTGFNLLGDSTNANGGTETRPINTSIKIWKRVS